MNASPRPTQATALYEERRRQVLKNLDRIREALKRHARDFDGRDWGFVGDLGYVIETTGEAANFLERGTSCAEILDDNPAGEG